MASWTTTAELGTFIPDQDSVSTSDPRRNWYTTAYSFAFFSNEFIVPAIDIATIVDSKNDPFYWAAVSNSPSWLNPRTMVDEQTRFVGERTTTITNVVNVGGSGSAPTRYLLTGYDPIGLQYINWVNESLSSNPPNGTSVVNRRVLGIAK